MNIITIIENMRCIYTNDVNWWLPPQLTKPVKLTARGKKGSRASFHNALLRAIDAQRHKSFHDVAGC